MSIVIIPYLPPGFGKTWLREELRKKADITIVSPDEILETLGNYKYYNPEKGLASRRIQLELIIYGLTGKLFIDKTNAFPNERLLLYGAIATTLLFRNEESLDQYIIKLIKKNLYTQK